ncbi:MAG: ornithine cyclodeaminase family protein, partial [Candidatus Binatia bacterium]
MSPSMPSQFLWLSEGEVVSLMDMGEAIAALEKGLLAEAQGQAQNMVKTHVAWNGSTLHAIGAAFPRAGFVGTKTWAHTEGGATPLVILFDSQTGNLKAVIEAFALGQLRTGAASGVATRCLAVRDAGEFAIIGTGKQALAQVAAVVAVRPIRSIRVFGRHKDRRSNFVSRTRQEFNLEVVEAASIREAVQGAQIITTATRATEPFLTADMISRGAHINSIGAIIPTRAEVAIDVMARCDQVVVDSKPQAQKLSRELM